MVQKIGESVSTLLEAGETQIVVMNLPPFRISPVFVHQPDAVKDMVNQGVAGITLGGASHTFPKMVCMLALHW